MTVHVRPALLRKMNERRVLEILRENGPASRADLTRVTGISAPTISKAVAKLIKVGLLEESDRDVRDGTLGRPGKTLQLSTHTGQVLGIVIDTQKCWIVSSGIDGQLSPRRMQSLATPEDYERLIDALADGVTAFSGDALVKTRGIGISVPGQINRREQRVVFSPNLHSTDGRSPARDLAERLGVETLMVQESHALCLAESMYGEAKGMEDFAMLDLSAGMGLGVMSGGRILGGHSGLGGELGHITVVPDGKRCGCGNRGCLETVATDTALATAVSKSLGRDVNIEEVISLAETAGLEIDEELSRTLEYLAIGVATVINLFNPASLFVHGRLFDVQAGLFDRLIELTHRRALGPSLADCRITRARGSKRQGAVAAIISHLTNSLGPALE